MTEEQGDGGRPCGARPPTGESKNLLVFWMLLRYHENDTGKTRLPCKSRMAGAGGAG